MKTYQDLRSVGQNENSRMDFIRTAINEWKGSKIYRNAVIAAQYFSGRNVTALEAQRMITKVTGEAIPDVWSPNYKIPSKFLYRFTTQKVNYSLGNGVSWGNKATQEKLGTKTYPLDMQLKRLGTAATNDGVAFGFFNVDHVEVFPVTEFVPLYDEENSALMAGIRFWRLDDNKPLRATLYETDGYTEYMWNTRSTESNDGTIKQKKRAYKQKIRVSEIGGTEIYGGENYPGFPIVPLWGNELHESEFTPIREQIDCYDLTKSGFCNNVDEASYLYWTIQNAGGMQDDESLEDFVTKLKTLHAVSLPDGVTASPQNVETPFQAREALLTRLERDLYRDAMALDVQNISGGAATATEIKAAYEPLNMKADDFEYQLVDFLNRIMACAGVDDKPTFTRSILVNTAESVQVILAAAPLLPSDYVTKKIVTLLGDGDDADKIVKQAQAERLAAMTAGYSVTEQEKAENEQRIQNPES